LVEYRQLWPGFEDFDGQGGDQNVKRRRKQIWDRFEADGFQVSADKFFWLEEIALHKDRYPNLASVTIKESESLWHGFGKHQWDLPPRLREVFEEAGVELKVTLRVPGKVSGSPLSLVLVLDVTLHTRYSIYSKSLAADLVFRKKIIPGCIYSRYTGYWPEMKLQTNGYLSYNKIATSSTPLIVRSRVVDLAIITFKPFVMGAILNSN